MPVELDLGKPPAGYAVSNAPAADTLVQVQVIEFTSTEDGQHFIRRLEGIPSRILAKFPQRVDPSFVNHLLAICRRDGKVTAYLNELTIKATVRATRDIEEGENVHRSDIAEVDGLELGVSIPPDAGFVFIFSVGWRKGMVYDFGPLQRDGGTRAFDVEAYLSQAYAHVLFQERFSVTDDEWAVLFDSRWFLFTGLGAELIDKLISFVRAGWNPDDLIDPIEVRLSAHADAMLNWWRGHSSFLPHIELLATAIERFKSKDYVSCTSILYPRIEGILRTHQTSIGATSTKPKELSGSAVASRRGNVRSVLLPHRFEQYLNDIYFANFDPLIPVHDVSRHSVAHGVAGATYFNRKSAVLGLLVAEQLFFFLENKLKNENDHS